MQLAVGLSWPNGVHFGRGTPLNSSTTQAAASAGPWQHPSMSSDCRLQGGRLTELSNRLARPCTATAPTSGLRSFKWHDKRVHQMTSAVHHPRKPVCMQVRAQAELAHGICTAAHMQLHSAKVAGMSTPHTFIHMHASASMPSTQRAVLPAMMRAWPACTWQC